MNQRVRRKWVGFFVSLGIKVQPERFEINKGFMQNLFLFNICYLVVLFISFF